MWGNEGSEMGGGGGFMSGNAATPTQGGGGGQKRQRAQNIVPIHIKDVLDNTEETFQVHGQEVGMVVVVGLVKTVDNQATKSLYQIQDDSGEIEAVHWVDVRNYFSFLFPILTFFHSIPGRSRKRLKQRLREHALSDRGLGPDSPGEKARNGVQNCPSGRPRGAEGPRAGRSSRQT